ncbi:hypothetical protein JCM8202_002832 [Rhodotorula sphaerocarpa]
MSDTASAGACQESFPSEFLAHHSPLCFVAGLEPPPRLDAAPDAAAPAARNDPFVILQHALHKALIARHKYPIWDASRGANADWHVVAVDKNVRFPPLKARPSAAAAAGSPAMQPGSPNPPASAAALHSPISPLTPTSPLYPDGLIAPIWIRKHRELVPSVFILVLRLHEARREGTPAATDEDGEPLSREDEERARDADLVAEIVDRKRTTLERGTKLAVILLCSRELLDDPQLDTRLSLIRRQSGLDSRASLFVISPVPQSEVNHFVHSLRTELFPAALDFYREHGRRVRRKRARIAVAGRGALSELGWNVRYDYKLALFAEVRGELEVALRHFEDCYDNLVEMFNRPGILPPRTKRWAEAKVLADCVSCKISKFYFYLSEPARAVAQLNRHVSRFHMLSTGWQIGQETFEFWSWLSKQYRLFGDLVSIALRSGCHLPSLRPPPLPRVPPLGAGAGLAGPSPGLVPVNILQHPGHHYYLAGLCAVERRDRFREMTRVRAQSDGKEPAGGQANPAYAHEAKVEHSEIIIELFTKAYEYFKVHRAKNMTYMIAHQIALAHLEANKPDVALKFLDRIVRSYRKDRFKVILTSILECIFRAAKEAEDCEALLRSGLELASYQSTLPEDRRTEYMRETIGWLQSRSVPTGREPAVLDGLSSLPLLEPFIAFLKPRVSIGEPVDFQISLSLPSGPGAVDIDYSRLELHIVGLPEPLRLIRQDASTTAEAGPAPFELGDLNTPAERPAPLSWTPGQCRIFSGRLVVKDETTVTLEKAILHAEVGGWPVMFRLPQPGPAAGAPRWINPEGPDVQLLQDDPTRCPVIRRDARVRLSAKCETPAFLDERFPVQVEVANEDDVEMEMSLVFSLRSLDTENDRIEVDKRSATSLIDDVSLGVLTPSSTARKTLHLAASGRNAGQRVVQVTLRATPNPATGGDDALLPAGTERSQRVTIPVIAAVTAQVDTQVFKRRRAARPTGVDEWALASDAMLVARLQPQGNSELEIQTVCLSAESAPSTRIVSSSPGYLRPEEAMSEPLLWRPGDAFNALFALQVRPRFQRADDDERLFLDITWKRSSSAEAPCRTRIALQPPIADPPTPTVSLILPPALKAEEQADIVYIFANPTPASIILTAEQDVTDPSTPFRFSGPRRVSEFLVPPQGERELVLRVVPTTPGQWILPRLRVWTVQHAQTQSAGGGLAKSQTANVTELEVDVEGDALVDIDPAQVELEDNLRTAREGDELASAGPRDGAPGRAPVVFVSPP